MRVMIVEDQQIILSGIKKMIQDAIFCEIETFLSGESALQGLETSPAPDVILSDIVMPGMDGLQFIERAKTLLPFCRFVIISGYDRFTFAQEAIRLGAVDYLLKPIERKVLLETLASLFRQIDAFWQRVRSACSEDFFAFPASSPKVPSCLEERKGGPGTQAGFYAVRRGENSLHHRLPGCYLMGETQEEQLYLLLLPTACFEICHRALLKQSGEATIGLDPAGDAAAAFLLCAAAAARRLGAAEKDTLAGKIQRYVDAHCTQALNVKRVARAVSLSPNYASALFKREMGISLSAYIRQRQLETAHRLLLTTDMRVYEIAGQLGYEDEKHFSALFRMQYHLSPNAVRRGGHTQSQGPPE